MALACAARTLSAAEVSAQYVRCAALRTLRPGIFDALSPGRQAVSVNRPAPVHRHPPAAPRTYVDERGAVGIRLEPAAAIDENQDTPPASGCVEVSATGGRRKGRSLSDRPAARTQIPAYIEFRCLVGDHHPQFQLQ